MPCEHCKGAHTLMNCTQIDMGAVHQQYQQWATQGYRHLKLYLDRQRVPLLKRLTRELGGVMNQNKRDLVLFCLVRASAHYPDTDNVQTNRQPRLVDEVMAVRMGAQEQIRQLFQQINLVQLTFSPADIQNILWRNARGGIVQAQHIPVCEPQYNTARPPHLLPSLWDRIAQQSALYGRINRISHVFSLEAIALLLHNLEVRFRNDLFSLNRNMDIPVQPLPQVSSEVPVQAAQVILKKEVNAVTKDETCCICVDSVCYVETNCRHSFCNCILHHLSKNGAHCPCCRQGVTELTYGQPEQYDALIRLLPILRHGTVRFMEE